MSGFSLEDFVKASLSRYFIHGFPNRIPCTPEMINMRPEIDAIIRDSISRDRPVPVIDRTRYLAYNGYYRVEEMKALLELRKKFNLN